MVQTLTPVALGGAFVAPLRHARNVAAMGPVGPGFPRGTDAADVAGMAAARGLVA